MSDNELVRRLAALISADVAGYSRLMADDEVATVRSMTACRRRVADVVRESGGRLVDFVGDNLLAEFPNTPAAVECALTLQRSLAEFNQNLAPHRHLNFRIGIHMGDVMSDGERIYGSGVNIAARLEALAEPGGICISDLVHRQIHGRFDLGYADLGEQTLKNIPDPVRVYKILTDEIVPSHPTPAVERPALPLPAQPSLAVLPFVNLATDAEQEQFCHGLTLDIMTALVQIPGLLLISDQSMFTYADQPVSVRELGRRLGVSHVLDGGVRRSGDRVRITARLIEAAHSHQVWARRFDRRLDDMFAVQDEITTEIVTAMDVKLVSGEQAFTVRRALKNPRAIECYYRGWGALFSVSRDGIRRALVMFEEMIRLDPDSPFGYAMAAWACWLELSQDDGESGERSRERAVELAREALRRRDITGLPDLVMAQNHLLDHEPDKALAAAEKAVLARPSCDASFAVKASVLNYLGRSAEAIELARFAMRLSPVYPSYYPAVLASAFYGSGQFQDAVEAAEISVRSDPNNTDALIVKAAAQAALGHADKAREAVRILKNLKPDFKLAAYAARQPYQNPQHLEQLLDHLRQAGL